MPKLKPISFEPKLNQRPKDSQHIIYSPALYQLRLSKDWTPQQHTKKFRKPDLLGFLMENQAAFCGKGIKASTQEAPPSFLDLVAQW